MRKRAQTILLITLGGAAALLALAALAYVSGLASLASFMPLRGFCALAAAAGA